MRPYLPGSRYSWYNHYPVGCLASGFIEHYPLLRGRGRNGLLGLPISTQSVHALDLVLFAGYGLEIERVLCGSDRRFVLRRQIVQARGTFKSQHGFRIGWIRACRHLGQVVESILVSIVGYSIKILCTPFARAIASLALLTTADQQCCGTQKAQGNG